MPMTTGEILDTMDLRKEWTQLRDAFEESVAQILNASDLDPGQQSDMLVKSVTEFAARAKELLPNITDKSETKTAEKVVDDLMKFTVHASWNEPEAMLTYVPEAIKKLKGRTMTEPGRVQKTNGTTPVTKADAMAVVDMLVEAKKREDPSLSTAQAIDRVVQEHPELYYLHTKAMTGAPIPTDVRRGPDPVDLVRSNTGQSWMPGILEKRSAIVLTMGSPVNKARKKSAGEWAIGKLDAMADELMQTRPDLDEKEAFTAIVVDGMTPTDARNPVKLLWAWIEGPESDLDLEVAMERPDIRAKLKEFGLDK